MINAEEINEKLEKTVEIWGMALTVCLKNKMTVTQGDERGVIIATNPLSSLIATAFVSFILGCFLNTYSINTWFLWAESSHHIHWFLGGILGVFPKIGKYTIPCFVITFLLKTFVL